MAATATQLTAVNPKVLVQEIGVIDFTSTTATVELTTYLSEIYGAVFTRIGDANAANAGDLTIDETVTSGVITPASNAITVDRQSSAGDGTLAAESFFYILYGKS